MPRLTTACHDCAALGPLASQRSLGVHSPRLDNDHWHPACRDASCGAQLRRNPPRHVVRRRPHLRQVDHLARRADDDPAEERCAVLAGRAVEDAGHVCEG